MYKRQLPVSPELPAYAAALAERPAYLPESPAEHALDVELCLLYTSDAADERSSVDLGGRRIIKKTKKKHNTQHTDN